MELNNWTASSFFYNRYRNGEDNVKGPDEERDEEFATGPLSLLMQVSIKTCLMTCLFVPSILYSRCTWSSSTAVVGGWPPCACYVPGIHLLMVNEYAKCVCCHDGLAQV